MDTSGKVPARSPPIIKFISCLQHSSWYAADTHQLWNYGSASAFRRGSRKTFIQAHISLNVRFVVR